MYRNSKKNETDIIFHKILFKKKKLINNDTAGHTHKQENK